MPHPSDGSVPTSSGNNRFANHRMLWVGGGVVVFLLIAILAPW